MHSQENIKLLRKSYLFLSALKFVCKERHTMIRRRTGNARREVGQDDFVCHQQTMFVMALNPASDVHSVGLFMSYMIESIKPNKHLKSFSILITKFFTIFSPKRPRRICGPLIHLFSRYPGLLS
jgi:hypothetical protein